MKHLIIFAHPNTESFGCAICRELQQISEAKGNQVRVRNLYEIGFNPVLSAADITTIDGGGMPADIKTEQQYVAEANHITFVYPVWWGGMPALMKGYLDRVFSLGFAYSYEGNNLKRLLIGKQGSVVCTTGASDEEYARTGVTEAMCLINCEVVFRFMGVEPTKVISLGNVAGVSRETRELWLSQLHQQFDEAFSED
ncbi:MAG: NAD(P)H-dependent oxidoreductase [Prevotellaceae bacterium]|jgi:NAD(P)H dehydrogenase (quinone)|nr:NAD(P)H-dependent oxidoreductase [Prevotellaceae bacterium]